MHACNGFGLDRQELFGLAGERADQVAVKLDVSLYEIYNEQATQRGNDQNLKTEMGG